MGVEEKRGRHIGQDRGIMSRLRGSSGCSSPPHLPSLPLLGAPWCLSMHGASPTRAKVIPSSWVSFPGAVGRRARLVHSPKQVYIRLVPFSILMYGAVDETLSDQLRCPLLVRFHKTHHITFLLTFRQKPVGQMNRKTEPIMLPLWRR